MSEYASFWARRKAAVQDEALAEERKLEEEERAQHLEKLSEKSDDEILQELGLPDPTDIKSGDAVSRFMSHEVPEHLRRQALRSLWRSNPVLACVDGLNEYDDDYRAAMLLSETVKTAYQVGKGMTSHIDEMERQAKEKAQALAEAEEAPQPQEAETALAKTQSDVSHEPAATSEHVQDNAALDEDAPFDVLAEAEMTIDDEAQMPPLRRMRFKFEENAA